MVASSKRQIIMTSLRYTVIQHNNVFTGPFLSFMYVLYHNIVTSNQQLACQSKHQTKFSPIYRYSRSYATTLVAKGTSHLVSRLRLPSDSGHLLNVDVALSLDGSHAANADLGDDDEHDGVQDAGEDVRRHVDVGHVGSVLVVVIVAVLLILEATAGRILLLLLLLPVVGKVLALPLDLVGGSLGGQDDGRNAGRLDRHGDGVVDLGRAGGGGDVDDEDGGRLDLPGPAAVVVGVFRGIPHSAKKFAQTNGCGAGGGGGHGVPLDGGGALQSIDVVVDGMRGAVLALRSGERSNGRQVIEHLLTVRVPSEEKHN